VNVCSATFAIRGISPSFRNFLIGRSAPLRRPLEPPNWPFVPHSVFSSGRSPRAPGVVARIQNGSMGRGPRAEAPDCLGGPPSSLPITARTAASLYARRHDPSPPAQQSSGAWGVADRPGRPCAWGQAPRSPHPPSERGGGTFEEKQEGIPRALEEIAFMPQVLYGSRSASR
jgi:hypothetical protein